MRLIPPEVAERIATFFESLEAADAGAAFHALHAPSARLLVRGQGIEQQAISATEFAVAHREAVLAAGGAEANCPLDAWEPASWQPTAEGGVAELIREKGVALRLRFGMVAPEIGWRVAWYLLETADEGHPALSFAKARALALGEFPFVKKNATPPYRAWLDVAYQRRFGAANHPPLHFLPEARFACAGSGHCCKMTWEVVVPEDAQVFLDALPYDEFAPDLAGITLEAKEGEKMLFLKRREDTCRFLDAQNRCRLHAYLGTPVFTPCVSFPLRFTETPAGFDVTASHTCGTVRQGLGPLLSAQQEDAYRRLLQAGAMVYAKPRLTRERDLDWPTYRAIVSELCQILRIDALPLHRRLWMMMRTMEAYLAGHAPNMDQAALEVLYVPDKDSKDMAATFLSYLLGVIAMLHDSLGAIATEQLTGTKLRHEARVAHWFENILFAKDLSSDFGLMTTLSLLVVFYIAIAALEAVYEDGPQLDVAIMQLSNGVDHRILADGGWKQLFELVPMIATQMDSPLIARLLLLYMHGITHTRSLTGEATQP